MSEFQTQAGGGDAEGPDSSFITGKKRADISDFGGTPQSDSAKGCSEGSKSLKTNEKEALVQSAESPLFLAAPSPEGGPVRDPSDEGSKARIGPDYIPNRVRSQRRQTPVADADRIPQRGQCLLGVS